uniref:Uncharacterized protein n=1 Tax=Fagus sylvatica TaxID=28930 RepID=A0A2N9EVB0_FAGSY
MEDNTLCGKRRKGLKDLDVGASATHTALMDQLSTLDAIAATTNDPQVYCGSGGFVGLSTAQRTVLGRSPGISQEYHPAVCAVISGAEDVGVSSSQFDDFSVAATSTCKARELKVC